MLEKDRGGSGRDWNGPAIAGTILAAIGGAVALGAWFYPRSPQTDPASGPSAGTSTSSAPATTTPAAPTIPATPASSASPVAGTVDRYLVDLSPVSGASALTEQAATHGFVLHCASGEADERSREVRWDTVGTYQALDGTVSVAGDMDPEAAVQVQWFAGAQRVFNDATLVRGSTRSFRADLGGETALRLRVTCRSAAGIVTFSNVGLAR